MCSIRTKTVAYRMSKYSEACSQRKPVLNGTFGICYIQLYLAEAESVYMVNKVLCILSSTENVFITWKLYNMCITILFCFVCTPTEGSWTCSQSVRTVRKYFNILTKCIHMLSFRFFKVYTFTINNISNWKLFIEKNIQCIHDLLNFQQVYSKN